MPKPGGRRCVALRCYFNLNLPSQSVPNYFEQGIALYAGGVVLDSGYIAAGCSALFCQLVLCQTGLFTDLLQLRSDRYGPGRSNSFALLVQGISANL